MANILTIDALFAVFTVCSDRSTDATEDWITVTSVANTLRYSKSRLVIHRAQILALLAELPDEFRAVAIGGGGGWTFLNMCYDRHGRHWGEQSHMDLLVSLGLATGAVRFMFARELWPALPGGVPYVEILTLQ
jgi:hypothetical protein